MHKAQLAIKPDFVSPWSLVLQLLFPLGALCSGIPGFVGMWVSACANVRVFSAARPSAMEALQVLFCIFGVLLCFSYVTQCQIVTNFSTDRCSCWWFLSYCGCLHGCIWSGDTLLNILCLAWSRFTWFNEGYRL
jgi:hypothetical protein